MPYRVDYGTIGEAKKTPQGGLAVPANLTRAGVFVYKNPDGSDRREWRPMSEVSRADTLSSLKGATLTVKHPPPGKLVPDNHVRYGRGHVGDDVRMDGDKTTATIYAQGKEALDAIAAGWREVSCGYDVGRMDRSAGIVPEGEPDAGQRYDVVQRDITYNHVALVPKGRGGEDVRLRLDANDNAITESSMKIETIGGIEHEVGTPAHADARARADAADKAKDTELAKLRTDAAEAKGKLDAATARIAAFEAEGKQRQDAADREVLVAKGAVVLGKEWKHDGLDNAAIAAAIIAKALPEVRLDAVAEAERPAYVKGLLAAIGTKPPAAKGKEPVPFRADGVDGAPRVGVTVKARLDSMAESDDACNRPLAMSKRKQVPFLQPTMTEQMR